MFDAFAERVAQAGEPWLTFFEPRGLEIELRDAGLGDVRDFGHDDLHARYFQGRTDGLRVGHMARIASARVTPRAGDRSAR